MRNGLAGHIGSIWNMMCRANCEDGFLAEACTKSYSLEDLYREVEDEMEAIAPCKNCKQCKCKEDREVISQP